MFKKTLVLLCCVAAFAVGCSKDTPSQGGAVKTPGEKSQAPEITVVSLDNQQLTLSALKGKVVLLNFWATWCPPCREEIPSMMKLNTYMAGKPFQMVCVSVDEGGKGAVESYFKNSGYSLPAYFDATGQAARTYGITGVPETFVIDKQGVIQKKVIGGLDWNSPEVIAVLESLMK